MIYSKLFSTIFKLLLKSLSLCISIFLLFLFLSQPRINSPAISPLSLPQTLLYISPITYVFHYHASTLCLSLHLTHHQNISLPRYTFPNVTYTFSHSLSLFQLSLFIKLSYFFQLFLFIKLSLSRYSSPIVSYTFTHSLSLSVSLFPTRSLSLTHILAFSLTRSLSLVSSTPVHTPTHAVISPLNKNRYFDTKRFSSASNQTPINTFHFHFLENIQNIKAIFGGTKWSLCNRQIIYFHLFFTVNSISYYWIWTRVLWLCNLPLCRLGHSHCLRSLNVSSPNCARWFKFVLYFLSLHNCCLLFNCNRK